MDPVLEIKARLPIDELVGEYVQLKKAGRNLKGLCPFHTDHNPSFMISPEKGIAWCFVCHSGGDIFEFFQKVEGVDFPEALQLLAERTGVVLPEYSGKDKISKDEKKEISEVLEASSKFFQEQFEKNQKAKDYWVTREINEETTKLFEVGYAPDSFTDTYKYLRSKDFHSEAITKSGMCIEKDDHPGEFFDRFRHRLMIPIKNHLGKVVGFGGRVIDKDSDHAKYLNSPDSPLYNKSYVLFALDKARDEIKKKDEVVVLEGYMDVIASFQAGVKNVVAVSGTALTSEQLKLIKRYTSNIKLCFDQDSAGREATKRSIELAADQDFNIQIVIIAGAKDCDELIKQGSEKWEQVIGKAISPLDFYFLDGEERFDLKDIVQQKTFVQETLERIKMFPHLVLQQEYVRRLAGKFNLDPRLLWEDFQRIKNKTVTQKQEEKVSEIKEKMSTEKYLLGMVMNYQKFAEVVQKTLVFHVFSDSETKDIYKSLLENYNAQAQLSDVFPEAFQEKLAVWQLFAEEKNEYCTEEELEKECSQLIRLINKQNLERAEQSLIQKMKAPDLPKVEQQEFALKLIEINKLKAALK